MAAQAAQLGFSPLLVLGVAALALVLSEVAWWCGSRLARTRPRRSVDPRARGGRGLAILAIGSAALLLSGAWTAVAVLAGFVAPIGTGVVLAGVIGGSVGAGLLAPALADRLELPSPRSGGAESGVADGRGRTAA